MLDKLKLYLNSKVAFSEAELDLIDGYFEIKSLRKKEFLQTNGTICDFVGFVEKGNIRHFHVKDGDEKTCDLSFENAWVTDFHSFNAGTPCVMNLQAMEDTVVLLIRKENLLKLYRLSNKFETFGRLMAEQVAQRATDIAMSLSSEKPEERFQNLLRKQPNLFQRVPQKYIANFLGVSPESLSRIRNRIFTKQKS